MDDKCYMLDTNTASYIIKGEPAVIRERLRKVPMANVCVSAITEAELLCGVAKKPDAKHLPIAVKEFILRVEILPLDSDARMLMHNCEQRVRMKTGLWATWTC